MTRRAWLGLAAQLLGWAVAVWIVGATMPW